MQLQDNPGATVERFRAYVRQHWQRMVNYQAYQRQGKVIGSGAVESSVKQIGQRVKLSGAQWEEKHVSQVLKQRCAYLNGAFSLERMARGRAG